jgi:membrane fusion protein (multidrug efflux system)
MAVNHRDKALLHLRTLFSVGAMGAPTDGQLLERFATGCGEPRELAFAALVERHGPSVLRVCRSVLRDEDAAEDAFQATFLALARKAGSLWAKDSLAPWLHQAAYRAAVHDRSAASRRRAHEHAASALQPALAAPPHHGNDDDFKQIIHEEIDRLPGRFRAAVVLCDLEGRTHEQAACHLGCAVGTVKSRLARGRKRLRGQLVRRGIATAPVLAAASAGGAARAAVPTSLAESTVGYAIAASAVPKSVAGITEGVLRSMFLSKAKNVMKVAAVVAAFAAGAVALARSGIGSPKDGTGKPEDIGSASWTYHILVSRNGEPPRKVAVVEMTGETPIRVDAPGALIFIQPKRDGELERQTAADRRFGDSRVDGMDEKAGRTPEDAAADQPIGIGGPASRQQRVATSSGAKASRSEQDDQKQRTIVLTSPKATDVVITRRYIGQIHSHRHINIRAFDKGHLAEIRIREGQAVKQGDLMFKITSALKKANLDAEKAEAELAQLEFDNTNKMFKQEKPIVSENEVRLFEAKLKKAKAKVERAQAELNFADIVAPFGGIVGRLHEQLGSLIQEGEVLTTLSDNSVMWVYFDVPEKQYLEDMANRKQLEEDKIELVLANQTKFPHPGTIRAIEANFNKVTGNIAFRADFPNPDGLLRHGQTGTILIHQRLHDAIVIPMRATFEINGKRYVYVVDRDDLVHQREIGVQNETDDFFVIKKGVGVDDRIVLVGITQVHDGERVEYDYRRSHDVMRKPKITPNSEGSQY